MNPTRSEIALVAFQDSAKRVQERLPSEALTSGFVVSRQPLQPRAGLKCGA